MRTQYTQSIGHYCLIYKKIVISVVILSLCFLISCSSHTKTPDIVVEYQVPFAASGLHWNEIEIVDNDEYGRKIYSYKSEGEHTNVFCDYTADTFNAPVLMYVLVQKNDDDFVYCYDDFCFVYVKSFEIDNSDIIFELKEKNDWNKPIQEKKLTAISIDIKEKVLDYPIYKAEEDAVATLEQFVGYKIDKYYLDAIFLPDATPIFVLREVESWEEITFGKSYVFSLPTEEREATYLELSNDIQNWNEEIHNFKTTLLADK